MAQREKGDLPAARTEVRIVADAQRFPSMAAMNKSLAEMNKSGDGI
jgi:hypothetical protein